MRFDILLVEVCGRDRPYLLVLFALGVILVGESLRWGAQADTTEAVNLQQTCISTNFGEFLCGPGPSKMSSIG